MHRLFLLLYSYAVLPENLRPYLDVLMYSGRELFSFPFSSMGFRFEFMGKTVSESVAVRKVAGSMYKLI